MSYGKHDSSHIHHGLSMESVDSIWKAWAKIDEARKALEMALKLASPYGQEAIQGAIDALPDAADWESGVNDEMEKKQ